MTTSAGVRSSSNSCCRWRL